METTQRFDVLSMLKNKLLQDYEPAEASGKTALLSTNEVYEAMQSVYPSETYDKATIAEWLAESGFLLEDMGDLRFLWRIAKKQ